MTTQSTALAESSVPRYTSYPTAPHFCADVGADLYGRWLSAIPAAQSISVYIHVPYCVEICHYCGCNTKAVRRQAPLDSYAQTLAAEIALVRRHLGATKVSHLHWGGGTPSILGKERLVELAARLGEAFDLSLGEHAIELDPRYIEPALAQALARMGVTRASLGVQDFSPHVQEKIGRVQPYAQVASAVAALRAAGISTLNFDMMYGLPGQHASDVARSAELALSLRPQRIALFGYAHVPWFKPHQRLIDEARLPGAAERVAQMRAAQAVFLSAGYQAIGLDHFALPNDDLAVAARQGRLRRNFQGYTNDAASALVGLGASAIGRLPQGFVQNAPDVAGYARAIADGHLATRRGLSLSADDRLRGEIIERLMCDLAVDLAAVARDFADGDKFEAEREELRKLAAEGIVDIDGERVTVSEAGRPFVRIVAAVFDAYLRKSLQRHSVAV